MTGYNTLDPRPASTPGASRAHGYPSYASTPDAARESRTTASTPGASRAPRSANITMTGAMRKYGALVTASLILFALFYELEKWFSFPGGDEIYTWLTVCELFLVGAVFVQVRFRGNLWYILLMLGTVVIFVTSAIQGPKVLAKSHDVLRRSVLVYALCPAVPLLISGKPLKTVLKCLITAWTILYAVISVVGIYALLNGLTIPNYSGEYIIGLTPITPTSPYSELALWTSHYNTSATTLAVSMLLAMVGAVMSESKTAKILFALAQIPMFAAMAMTSGRTGELGSLIGFGFAAACALQKRMALRFPGKGIRVLLSALLIIVICVTGIIGYLGVQKGINAVIRMKAQGGSALLPLPSACAEEESFDEDISEGEGGIPADDYAERSVSMDGPSGSADERGFFTGKFLTNRDKVWKDVIKVLSENPQYLLTGMSIPRLISTIRKLNPQILPVSHLHNIYLQILASTGIVGLILAFIFIFFTVRAAVTLFFDTERPLWERLVFTIPIAMFLMQFVESFRLSTRTDVYGIMTLFAGMTIVFAKKSQKSVRG